MKRFLLGLIFAVLGVGVLYADHCRAVIRAPVRVQKVQQKAVVQKAIVQQKAALLPAALVPVPVPAYQAVYREDGESREVLESLKRHSVGQFASRTACLGWT